MLEIGLWQPFTLLSPDLSVLKTTKGWQNPRWFLFLRRSRNSPVRWPRELPIAWIKQPLKGATLVSCPDANKSKKCHSHAGIPSAPGQDSEHESESSTLVSFITVSSVFMTASYLPASQRRRLDCDSSKVWNHLDTGWSNNKIQTSTTSSHDSHDSLLGDHLAGDEQSRHCNGKSKGFERSVSLPVEFSQIPRPVRHPVKPLTILYKSTNMYLTYINKYVLSH